MDSYVSFYTGFYEGSSDNNFGIFVLLFVCFGIFVECVSLVNISNKKGNVEAGRLRIHR